MPIYHRLGKIPPKRHTQFRKANGDLYYEQLFGTIGFDGMSSLLYHVHRPTRIADVGEQIDLQPVAAVEKNIKSRKLIGFNIEPEHDYLESRKVLLFNNDVHISLAAPTSSVTSYF